MFYITSQPLTSRSVCLFKRTMTALVANLKQTTDQRHPELGYRRQTHQQVPVQTWGCAGGDRKDQPQSWWKRGQLRSSRFCSTGMQKQHHQQRRSKNCTLSWQTNSRPRWSHQRKQCSWSSTKSWPTKFKHQIFSTIHHVSDNTLSGEDKVRPVQPQHTTHLSQWQPDPAERQAQVLDEGLGQFSTDLRSGSGFCFLMEITRAIITSLR